MRKRLLLVPLLLLLPSWARADMAYVAWDSCGAIDGSEYGFSYKSFACASNLGSETLVGTFSLYQDFPQFMGMDATVIVAAWPGDPAPLPDWWQFFNSGSCRQSALSVSVDFSSDPPSKCTSAWEGQTFVGIGSYELLNEMPYPGYSHPLARLTLVGLRDVPGTLQADVLYNAFKLVISNQKTIGADACGGCCRKLGIGLTGLHLVSADGNNVWLSTYGTALWQDQDMCPVKAERPTWGAIKSLYR